jgi:hypothetical protein
MKKTRPSPVNRAAVIRSFGQPRLWLIGALLCVVPTQARSGPPLILTQSASMEVREERAFAALVVATGGELEYQWYHEGESLDGRTDDTLLLGAVSGQDAGNYHVVVSNASGSSASGPIALEVGAAPDPGVSPGGRGLVAVPGHAAYYDLSLPHAYGLSRHIPPVLFTFSPGGGGMVDHFRTVAGEKGWVVVGVSQSRNLQGGPTKMLFSRAVVRHALDHLRIDPNRIFVAGMSGGGWSSFDTAKINAPLFAGVFSMGGWLGQQYSTQRDIYLPGLLVARANGDTDAGANSWLSRDRGYLQNYLSADNIRDWSFSGGHGPAPPSVQREVIDWFHSRTTPSASGQRDLALEKEALWKARITAGEVREVYEEIVFTAFNQPRTPDALAAWRVLDFLFSESRIFLRETPADFAEFPRRNYLAVNLHHALFAFIQQRDPSQLFSAIAAAKALGPAFENVQADPVSETGNILRHTPVTPFDAFVLEHGLHDHPEPPLTGDWDGDGRDNFSEFVTGSDSLVADPPPSPTIRIVDHEAFVTLPGARGDRTLRLAAEATDDPADGWRPESLAPGTAWWRPAPDGSFTVTRSLGDNRTRPRLFARFSAGLHQDHWHDANADGIPYEYLFPGDPFVEDPVLGDSPDLPDARRHTDIPGGPPTYLLYLTAAEIGPVQGRDGSLRYHPALAGYRGSLYHEVWMNVPGSKITDAASAVARRPPNEVRLITASEAPWFSVDAPSTMGDHYFERSRGYIVPDSTGNHVFMIAGDDESELWLSTAASPDNAVRIAHVSNWTGYRDFTRNASQTSAPVRLRAGSRYYVEILHKEGNGLDHCSVAWIPPGGSDPVIIPSANLQCLPLELIEGGGE